LKQAFRSFGTYAGAGCSIILLLVFSVFPAPLGAEKTVFFGKHDKTVVLDAGHGGRETGAAGVAGLVEKSITMQFAGILEATLKNRYNVYQTRNDNYLVSIADRAAVANHFQADVFVSIHAGGAFRSQTSGMAVYTYGSEFRDRPVDAPAIPVPPAAGSIPAWSELQVRHMTESRKLAASIHGRLAAVGVLEIRSTREAPLKILESADCPAVLLEIATITNPMDETSIGKPGNLQIIAEAVAEGIDRYLGMSSE
jgi:N-acetylmuramoyl-L-alanine amidase